MRKGLMAGICAAAAMALAGQASAGIIFQESGALPASGPFQILFDPGPSPTVFIGAQINHYQLLVDGSTVTGLTAGTLDYSSRVYTIDGVDQLGGAGEGTGAFTPLADPVLIAQGAFGGVGLPPDFDITFDQDGHTVHQSAIYRYGFELNGTSLGPAGTPYVFQLIGIPEPASWALMLTGFFGLGGALRARRRMALA